MNNQHEILSRFEKQVRLFIESIPIPAPQVREAILYVVFSGGKRLRPQLVYLVGELLQVPLPLLDPIAIAIELTHTYSLVHDDLPAMDNDDLRRGRPTCHIAYTEACAILTGDALQSLAITALTDGFPAGCSADIRINMIRVLLEASGPSGMISGQDLDLTLLASSDPLTEVQLQTIHHLKTTALIQACIRMVFCAAEDKRASHEANLIQFGHHLGLAYQMQDDYLDKYASELIGKAHASDEANQKQTFSTLYPQTHLKSLIHHTFNQAKEALASYGEHSTELLKFLDQINRLT